MSVHPDVSASLGAIVMEPVFQTVPQGLRGLSHHLAQPHEDAPDGIQGIVGLEGGPAGKIARPPGIEEAHL